MEIRDVLLALALLVSSASLIVSWRGARFTARIKLIELRNTALCKIAEMRVGVDRVDELRESLSLIPEIWGHPQFQQIAPRLMLVRSRLSGVEYEYRKAKIESEADLQAKYSADLHFVQKSIEELERNMKELKDFAQDASKPVAPSSHKQTLS